MPCPSSPKLGWDASALPSLGNPRRIARTSLGAGTLTLSAFFLHPSSALAGYSGATCSFFWVDMGRRQLGEKDQLLCLWS